MKTSLVNLTLTLTRVCSAYGISGVVVVTTGVVVVGVSGGMYYFFMKAYTIIITLIADEIRGNIITCKESM